MGRKKKTIWRMKWQSTEVADNKVVESVGTDGFKIWREQDEMTLT